jgi:hypothetical protein
MKARNGKGINRGKINGGKFGMGWKEENSSSEEFGD